MVSVHTHTPVSLVLDAKIASLSLQHKRAAGTREGKDQTEKQTTLAEENEAIVKCNEKQPLPMHVKFQHTLSPVHVKFLHTLCCMHGKNK